VCNDNDKSSGLSRPRSAVISWSRYHALHKMLGSAPIEQGKYMHTITLKGCNASPHLVDSIFGKRGVSVLIVMMMINRPGSAGPHRQRSHDLLVEILRAAQNDRISTHRIGQIYAHHYLKGMQSGNSISCSIDPQNCRQRSYNIDT
jgi:hypothetical protein